MEVLNYTSVIDMSQPTVGSVMRKLSYRHLANEARWILTGDSLLSTIAKTAPQYSKFSDDGRTLQGAYGPVVVSQMNYVIDVLNQDLESRQAVMSLWRPNPRPSKDIPCTVSMQFLVRDLKLHCITNMRSSDIWLGFPYDVFCFTMITTMILVRINRNIELGTLFLNAGSSHLYEKNIGQARACLSEVGSLAFLPMSSHGINTPDDLLNDLSVISHTLKQDISSPHLESIYNHAQAHK